MEHRILWEPDRCKHDILRSMMLSGQPCDCPVSFALFPFLSHCLCVSGTLELVAWALCPVFILFHPYVEDFLF